MFSKLNFCIKRFKYWLRLMKIDKHDGIIGLPNCDESPCFMLIAMMKILDGPTNRSSKLYPIHLVWHLAWLEDNVHSFVWLPNGYWACLNRGRHYAQLLGKRYKRENEFTPSNL